MFFLHVQDFVDAYIGPFAHVQSAEDHYQWTKDQGDGAIKIEIIAHLQEEGEFILTPEENKTFDRS